MEVSCCHSAEVWKESGSGDFRQRIGEILQELCRHKGRYKGADIEEGHVMPDHIYMVLSVPPKYSIAMIIRYLKSKSAIRIH